MEEAVGLLDDMKAVAEEREVGCRRVGCLTLSDVSELARKYVMSTRQVSIYGLRHGYLPTRYLKNVGTIGLDGQARLLESAAVLVGVGGLGGTSAELLARMGVGRLVVVDPDVYDETNLNRQNFACGASLGHAKVDVVAERILEINCDIEVSKHRMEGTRSNLPALLRQADVVIDGLDNLDDRLALQEACSDADKVMVHGAIAGSSLQVTTIFPGDSGLTGMALSPVDGEKTTGKEKATGVEIETGNPATTPVLCAVIQVQEAIKVMLDSGTVLRNRMLYMDLEDWAFEFLEL